MRTISVTFGLFAFAALVPAQSFDVGSVKVDNGPFIPGVSGRMSGGPGTSDPGRWTVTRMQLKFIMMRAFSVAADQVAGPGWIDDISGPNFTIAATMPPDATKEQFQLMLQNLLAERFHLTLHHETRLFPGYDLTLAAGGPKLKSWAPDPNYDPKNDAASAGPDAQGFPRLRPNQPGFSFSVRMGGSGPARSSHRQSMPEFARSLGGFINTSNAMASGVNTPRVSDKTGLTGLYEFKLEFEGTAVLPGGPLVDGTGGPPAANDPGQGGPNLFTAIEKQLGLRLVKTKEAPVDVLVIDHIDKTPVEN